MRKMLANKKLNIYISLKKMSMAVLNIKLYTTNVNTIVFIISNVSIHNPIKSIVFTY